jgi:modification methylase
MGDCLEQMRKMDGESVDLIFTSPPYNLGLSSGAGIQNVTSSSSWKTAALANGYGNHDDALPLAEYIAWQQEVLTECWRLLTVRGAVYYNHKPRIQNGVLWTPLECNPGLPIRQIVTWVRDGGINFNPTYYLPTYEWIIILAKPGFRLRDQAASCNKDVWHISQERGNSHPAPFPVALPRMALSTIATGVVLDPFMGSGSTGVAAMECGWDFIGIEKESRYLSMANHRITLAERLALDPMIFMPS